LMSSKGGGLKPDLIARNRALLDLSNRGDPSMEVQQ
jgi:hypothetical protein